MRTLALLCLGGCAAAIEPGCEPVCVSSPTSWNNARRHCEQEYGTTLVSVLDQDTNDWLRENGPFDQGAHCVWTGFNDKSDEGTWTWKQGDPTGAFEDWHSGEPNNAFGLEDCMAVCADENHNWHDFACASYLPFCCGAPASTCSSERDDAAAAAADGDGDAIGVSDEPSDEPQAPDDASGNFCAMYGFVTHSFEAELQAQPFSPTNDGTCREASDRKDRQWARCCCGHARDCCPEGELLGCFAEGATFDDDDDATDDDDAFDAAIGSPYGSGSSSSAKSGKMRLFLAVFIVGTFALVSLSAREHRRRVRIAIDSHHRGEYVDPDTGLHIETATMVEMT